MGVYSDKPKKRGLVLLARVRLDKGVLGTGQVTKGGGILGTGQAQKGGVLGTGQVK